MNGMYRNAHGAAIQNYILMSHVFYVLVLYIGIIIHSSITYLNSFYHDTKVIVSGVANQYFVKYFYSIERGKQSPHKENLTQYQY